MRITIISLLVWLPFAAFSQSDNTNSPYARYGYGVLADPAFASQRGMGGVGYGLRNSQIINPLNPASFSAVDSMTFMLDFGVKGQIAFMNDVFGSARRYNGGLEYLAIQLPLAKGFGMGVGIEPISFVGYQYGDTSHVMENVISAETYSGNGGLNKVYGTLSYNFFKRLSLGVNVGYLFGDVIHNRQTISDVPDSYTTLWTDSLRMTGLAYEFGLQYTQKLQKNAELTFGLVYSPRTKIQGKVGVSDARYNASGQVTGNPQYYHTRDSVFEMPETFGVGITYRIPNKLTVGADFKFQQWANAKFYDQTDYLSNRMKINAGIEYIPNPMRNQLYNKLHYRAGAYFANSYIIDTNSSKYNEYGLSLGVGIPMIDRRSSINMAIEYAWLTPQKVASMNEKYVKFTLSYTFNELWFFKQKLQ